MRIIKFISVFLFLAFMSCVENYDFYALTDFETLYVVDAALMNTSDTQTILISQTISPNSIDNAPVSGCLMEVIDIHNNVFPFHEVNDEPGVYKGVISSEYFVTGNAFKLQFVGPNGKDYESDFQPFIEAAEVDSVYYEVLVDYIPPFSSTPQHGVQVYLDLAATGNQSEYYHYILEETYEFRSTYPIQRYWAGSWIDLGYEDWSYSVCYKTENSKNIEILSTAYQAGNEFKQHPLLFINNQSVKLYYRYSLLVNQLSVSKEIYDYWRILRETSEENNNLLGKQPVNAKGNMVCACDTEEAVLGYFSVSDVKQKRIFLQNVPGLNFDTDFRCESSPLRHTRWITQSKPDQWPIYLTNSGEYDQSQCFDCRLSGGVIEIPEFWQDK